MGKGNIKSNEGKKWWYIRIWQWIKEFFSNILSKLGIKRKGKKELIEYINKLK